jgi:hypothetical protein
MYETPTSFGISPSVCLAVDSLVEAKVDLFCAHVSQVLKNGLVELDAVEAQARYPGLPSSRSLRRGVSRRTGSSGMSRTAHRRGPMIR